MALQRHKRNEQIERNRNGLVSLKCFNKLPMELKLDILELTFTRQEVGAALMKRAIRHDLFYNNRNHKILRFRFDGVDPVGLIPCVRALEC